MRDFLKGMSIVLAIPIYTALSGLAEHVWWARCIVIMIGGFGSGYLIADLHKWLDRRFRDD